MERRQKFVYQHLLSLRQGGMSSSGLLEAKNEEKQTTKLFFFENVQSQFAILRA